MNVSSTRSNHTLMISGTSAHTLFVVRCCGFLSLIDEPLLQESLPPVLPWDSVSEWICTDIVMQVITHNSCNHILCWFIAHVHMLVKALFSDECTLGPPALAFADLPDRRSWSAVGGMLYLYATKCMISIDFVHLF